MTPDNLKKYLDQQRITQTTFAKRIGVTDRTVRRWLSGASPIPKMLKILLSSSQ
jgi:transcriptional regulator with XRE-family HTH domain